MADLEVRRDRYYLKGKKSAYSGRVVAYFPTRGREGKRLYMEGEYENGWKTDTWTTYRWDGGKEVAQYRFGKRNGSSRWYYPRDRIQREQYYRHGQPHGDGTLYDIKGNITKQLYYENGKLIPPPPEDPPEEPLRQDYYGKRTIWDKALSAVKNLF
ncbi:MAG: hypothetical protein HQL52_16125 [Magnetococcales bacterium]|nr:hypothetical protein [Magnetococcales bacterium]